MKKFILGFLVCAMLVALSIPILAKTTDIKAFYNNIKLTINGKNVAFAEGEEPFIVNGRTYVPAKYVAENLNATVSWNETDNAVVIKSKDIGTTSSVSPALGTQSATAINSAESIDTIDGFQIYNHDNKEYISFSDVIASLGKKIHTAKIKNIYFFHNAEYYEDPEIIGNDSIDIKSFTLYIRITDTETNKMKQFLIAEKIPCTYIWKEVTSIYEKCISKEDYKTYFQPLLNKTVEQICREADK